MGDRYRYGLLLGLLLCLAVCLRAIGLDTGLWYDEIVTLVEYVRLPTRDLVTDYSTLNNHILYSLSAQASLAVFGENAWSLRLPAMVFGVASIAAFWWLATQVVSRSEALWGTLLLTVSYHHIWFSQNARAYTGLLLCTLLATSLFLKGIDNRSRWTWIGYGLVFAIAMYFHLSAVFLFATHGLVYLGIMAWRRWRGAKERVDLQPMVGFGLGGLLTLLLYAVLIPQMLSSFGDASGVSSLPEVREWKNPVWTVLEVYNSVARNGWIYAAGIPLAIALMSIGALSFLRRNVPFALIAIAHIPFTAAILLATGFRIWPRYFFVDAGFAILMMVHGMFVVSVWLSNRFKSRGLASPLFVATMLGAVFASLWMLPRNYQFPKQDFVGARDFVERSRHADDVVVSVGLASTALGGYYTPQWQRVETAGQLQDLQAKGRPVWLVYSFSAHTKARHSDILAIVAKDFELRKELPGTLGDGTVFVYRTREPDTRTQ